MRRNPDCVSETMLLFLLLKFATTGVISGHSWSPYANTAWITSLPGFVTLVRR